MRVAVVLSGCGVYDGAEIHESVFTLLSLSQRGAEAVCLAPDMPQQAVIDHLSGDEQPGAQRNVLIEAARIARGAVGDLAAAEPGDFDAAILPGGFGVVRNFSDYISAGSDCQVLGQLQAWLQGLRDARRPVGLLCIAPVLAARIYGAGVRCTIGDDADTAADIEAMGARHQDCAASEICIDRERRLVTAPAYMLGQSPAEVWQSVDGLVAAVLALAGES